MGLELLEYQVFRQNSLLGTDGNEIDSAMVPVGQTWRLEHLSVAMTFPHGEPFSSPANPQVGVYDVAQPAANVVPCQITQLSPLIQNGQIAGLAIGQGSAGIATSWVDVDDDPGITLLPGAQLAVIFYSYWIGQTTSPAACSVRAEFSVYQGTSGQPQPAAGLQPGPAIPVSI